MVLYMYEGELLPSVEYYSGKCRYEQAFIVP